MYRNIFAVASLLAVSATGWSVSNYDAVNIGSLGGGGTVAHAMNDLGQIVGISAVAGGADNAFLYSGGVMTDLTPSAPSGWTNITPMGINNLGQIVGSYSANGTTGAFFYSGGLFQDLGSPLGGGRGQANAINDAGQITGFSQTSSFTTHAFLYSTGGTTDLGTNGKGSFGNAINASGEVAGDNISSSNVLSAFIYSGGSMHDIGNLGGTGVVGTDAVAINAGGDITGSSLTASLAQHAFLYSGGVMIDLGTLSGGESGGNGIDNLDEVVGGSGGHAFLYSGGTMYDLNSLITGTNPGILGNALHINNASQIVATTVGGTFLLSPTAAPEPVTMATLGLGAIGLLRRRSKKS